SFARQNPSGKTPSYPRVAVSIIRAPPLSLLRFGACAGRFDRTPDPVLKAVPDFEEGLEVLVATPARDDVVELGLLVEFLPRRLHAPLDLAVDFTTITEPSTQLLLRHVDEDRAEVPRQDGQRFRGAAEVVHALHVDVDDQAASLRQRLQNGRGKGAVSIFSMHPRPLEKRVGGDAPVVF